MSMKSSNIYHAHVWEKIKIFSKSNLAENCSIFSDYQTPKLGFNFCLWYFQSSNEVSFMGFFFWKVKFPHDYRL